MIPRAPDGFEEFIPKSSQDCRHSSVWVLFPIILHCLDPFFAKKTLQHLDCSDPILGCYDLMQLWGYTFIGDGDCCHVHYGVDVSQYQAYYAIFDTVPAQMSFEVLDFLLSDVSHQFVRTLVEVYKCLVVAFASWALRRLLKFSEVVHDREPPMH
jgi:hypothetical protein